MNYLKNIFTRLFRGLKEIPKNIFWFIKEIVITFFILFKHGIPYLYETSKDDVYMFALFNYMIVIMPLFIITLFTPYTVTKILNVCILVITSAFVLFIAFAILISIFKFFRKDYLQYKKEGEKKDEI